MLWPVNNRPNRSLPHRYNHEIVPGRTIVVGTEQGLYARVAPLAEPVLRMRSTKEDVISLEQEFPLDAEVLAKVGSSLRCRLRAGPQCLCLTG